MGSNHDQSFVVNIRDYALNSDAFRDVIHTGSMQLTTMTLRPMEDIGLETHPGVEQFLYIVRGSGVVKLDSATEQVNMGDAIIIRPGTAHNLKNVGITTLHLLSLYSSPQHSEGLLQIENPGT